MLRNNEEPDTISNNGISFDCESLPSYSIASGLPSYEEALRQLQNVKRTLSCKKPTQLPRQDSNVSVRQELTRSISRVSVMDYLQSLVQEKSWQKFFLHFRVCFICIPKVYDTRTERSKFKNFYIFDFIEQKAEKTASAFWVKNIILVKIWTSHRDNWKPSSNFIL